MLTVALLAIAFASVQLDGFPFVKQKPDFCGEADVEMAMRRLHHEVTQDQVFALADVDPTKGRGAVTNELAAALRALGSDPGPVWFHPKSASDIDAQFAALHADLAAGTPSIVCMHYSDEPHTTEHFRLITGYDADTDEVVYQEPAEDNGAGRRMKRALFVKLWTFHPSATRNTMIRLRVPAPEVPPSIAPESAPTKADAVQHVMQMKDDGMLPASMTLAWEKPFLVVGDEGAAQVRERAKGLVRWTRDLLLKDFFDAAPSTLQEVWILKDADSYVHTSKTLFKNTPDTPYGYYLSGRRALIMNIKPGYGTLTHELVHPFFDEAWGEPPAWMNEGVASLFERPAEKAGHLVGKVNWRLPGLLDGLKRDDAPSFHDLVHFTTDEFYDDDTGVHYAEARYLCYWLQERGLLSKVVRRAHELRAKDPTGWSALTEVLGKDPDAFRAEWETYVKGLTS